MPVLQTNPTSSQLMASAANKSLPNLNRNQQHALLNYAKSVQLKWDNGTNYVGASDQLVADAMVATSGMSEADIDAALVGIEVDQANSDSAVDMPPLIGDQLAKVRLFSTRDPLTQKRVNLLLSYLLLKRVGGG